MLTKIDDIIAHLELSQKYDNSVSLLQPEAELLLAYIRGLEELSYYNDVIALRADLELKVVSNDN